MTARSTEHATFAIERTYPAAPERVFAAWASVQAKSQWFGPRAGGGPQIELDFQVGGRERFQSGPPGGPLYTYLALFQDIVPDQRIVYTYEMHMDDQRISVSVATVELHPAGTGTKLVLTEQGVYLDGLDTPAQREHGTRALLENLGTALQAA